MLIQFITGAVLIGITVTIHALTLDRLMRFLEHVGNFIYHRFNRMWKVITLLIAFAGVFAAHIAEIWVWAFFYLISGALPDFEEALYFSTATFTTVGFGDVVLDKTWRLVSSFQAANGFILFGWSTAFIFEVMSRIYSGRSLKVPEKKESKD